MVYIKKTPPWEMNQREKEEYASGNYKKQQAIMDRVMAEKKKWEHSGSWGSWERGRKRALRERRDYFREHPDKKDDFTGV